MEQASTSTVDLNHLREWFKYNFPILDGKFEPAVRNDALEATPESLKDLPVNFCVHSVVVPQIHKHFRQVTAPRFWSKFENVDGKDEQQGFVDFTIAVNELYEETLKFQPMLKKLQLAGKCNRDFCLHGGGIEPVQYFWLMLRAVLLSQLPLNPDNLPGLFYRVAFNVFCNIEATSGVTPSGSRGPGASACVQQAVGCSAGRCEGCSQELSGRNGCRCQAIVDTFHEVNKRLLELGLLERLAGNTLTWLIEERIEGHVARVCARSFDASQLQPLDTWLETVVMSWLVRIYAGGSSRCSSLEPRQRDAVNTFKQKLSYFMYETYTRQRIDQLFNIVIEYPDSRPAIDDLRVCLERTDMRRQLVRSLKAALRSRLLHPGVSTPDILTAYIAAIKALRQLEPRGVLLETITEPIKSYLRGREDTVRCVVSGLLDESSTSELADELSKGAAAGTVGASATATSATPADEQQDWENWQPDPVDAAFDEDEDRRQLLAHGFAGDATMVAKQYETSATATNPGGPRKVSDIITMLVNVYGSQDLFVNEYRTLLADRLLTQLNYQTERELRQLELLKRRFGEQQLHHCEVMIKDMHDSKRIDEHIQADKTYCSECAEAAATTTTDGNASFPTSALVLSAQFWPPFKEDWRLELPGPIQRQLQRYVRAFEAYKGSRTLCWKTHLGNVNLDVETSGGRRLNFNVSPIHASIILCFERRAEWSLDDLSTELHVPTTVLRRKIGLWLSHGLLAESLDARDTFVTVEAAPPGSQAAPHQTAAVLAQPAAPVDMILDEEELESAMASASDQREEELQVFWSYIVGMLTNLDSMPLDRIHQMLKMFASQGSGAVECGLPELRLFLDKKVREHQLLFSGGLYKLPKP
ncbi:hypothetical protein QAD02_002063 [Eretmocerus hayati]|uniref:Uncharacterized protein n=1 Tax=Eretmocerus hayati TaxID=131215 RepID=A0ACC2NKF3_9HYME|nr:hypothetical protein QAD02_002063 [Eretmocerus hayati]